MVCELRRSWVTATTLVKSEAEVIQPLLSAAATELR